MQSSRRKATLWALAVQGATIALMLASNFALVPIYLRFVSVETYGSWLASVNVLAWIGMIDPGIGGLLQQRTATAYGRGELSSIGRVFYQGLLLTGIAAAILMLVVLAVVPWIAQWVGLHDLNGLSEFRWAFVIAGAAAALSLFAFSVTAVNLGMLSAAGVSLISIGINLASLFVTIFLLYEGFGLVALAGGVLFRSIGWTGGNALYLLWRFRNERVPLSFDLEGFGSFTRSLSYTFVSRASYVVAGNIDAFLMAIYAGPGIASVLVLSKRAPEALRMFLERPAVALGASISNLAGAGEIESTRALLTRFLRGNIWMAGLLGGGVVLFNGAFVSLWVGPGLYVGTAVNLLLAVGLVLAGLSAALLTICYALGDIEGSSKMTMAQNAVTLALLAALGASFGLIGLVAAPSIAVILTAGWYLPRSFARRLHVDASLAVSLALEGLRAIAIAGLAGLAFTMMDLGSWWRFCAAGLGFVLLYLVLLLASSSAARAELRRLKPR